VQQDLLEVKPGPQAPLAALALQVATAAMVPWDQAVADLLAARQEQVLRVLLRQVRVAHPIRPAINPAQAVLQPRRPATVLQLALAVQQQQVRPQIRVRPALLLDLALRDLPGAAEASLLAEENFPRQLPHYHYLDCSDLVHL
jgi:hypothetical protein